MCIGTFLCMMDTTVMNIALPAIQTDLNVPLSQLSWALNIYTITFAVLTIPLARIADIFGRNKVYVIGLLLLALGSMVAGIANISIALIIGRAIQSVGAAIVFPTSMTIGIESSESSHRDSALLTIGIVQGLASALGPTIGGVITQFLEWRWIFFFNLPPLLIALIAVLLQLPVRHESRIKAKIDFGGMLLSMAALFSLTMILTQGSDWGWTSSRIIMLTIVTITAFIGFIFVEKAVKQPMIRLDLFADRQFSGTSLAVILSGLLLITVIVIMPTFYTQIQGKSELMAALLITPAEAMVFVVAPIAGTIIYRVGPRIVIFTGFVSMAISYAILGFTNPNHYWQTFIGLLFLGFGYGTVIGPVTVLSASDFKGEKLTASQSVMGVLRQIGNVLAVAIFVSLLTVNINTAKVSALKDANDSINRTALDATTKKTMKSITRARLSGDSIKTSDHSTSSISKKELNQLIEKRTKVEEQKENVDQFSEPKRTVISKQIKSIITKKIMTIVYRDNRIIKKTSINISTKAKYLMTEAFLVLYRWTLPASIVFIAVCLFFYRRNKFIKFVHGDSNQ
ncbi:DHA2 family efflux MFS transporter permease subunit [Oenococcus sp. UCMA 17063]|nr:DHA2 family efflux MFS transporter permease subunit [Oenococcus sp. UCMA 17063]